MTALDIPGVLKMIDPGRVDPEIMARCQAALRLYYRGKPALALEQGQATILIAAKARCIDKRNFAAETRRRISIGVALLYLTYIRHLSDTPRIQLTGQLAITWLRQDDHHHGLAELIMGRVLLERGQTAAAVEHYRAAAVIFSRLIETRYHKHKLLEEKTYIQLYETTQEIIRGIQLPDQPRAIPVQPLAEDFSGASWLDRVSIPSKLVWPGDYPAGLQLMSMQTTGHNQVILLPKFEPVPGGFDYMDVEQISLNNRLYQINAARQPDGKFRMHASQPYYTFQFATMHDPPQPGELCYALVRQFDGPSRSDYPIVILISEEKQAWLVSSQPSGAAETIIGEREWTFYEGGPRISESKVQVVGVVVAILTPVPA